MKRGHGEPGPSVQSASSASHAGGRPLRVALHSIPTAIQIRVFTQCANMTLVSFLELALTQTLTRRKQPEQAWISRPSAISRL